MSLNELLERAAHSAAPVSKGTWATVVFRPDLGSQQEFVVGAVARVDEHRQLHTKWIPTIQKLSTLYGDAISSVDTKALFVGVEAVLRSASGYPHLWPDCGTPHMRIQPCGFFAANDIESELTQLLRRQASAIWSEPHERGVANDDEWAYHALVDVLDRTSLRHLIVPHRAVYVGQTRYQVALDNGVSLANVVSARYAHFSTVQAHIFQSLLEVQGAHRALRRLQDPALFVVLPDGSDVVDVSIARKSVELLEKVQSTGVQPFCAKDPQALAESVQQWALQQ
jgi:hypothetical protein